MSIQFKDFDRPFSLKIAFDFFNYMSFFLLKLDDRSMSFSSVLMSAH